MKVIKSVKITSANNYGWIVDSSEAMKALDMWIEAVGEENALEDIARALSTDDLKENIEWVARQWGFSEELEDIEDAWDKYEYAKEVMGVSELLTNLSQAIGYDELSEDMAYIFRMNDFREWKSDYENSDDYDEDKITEENKKDEVCDFCWDVLNKRPENHFGSCDDEDAKEIVKRYENEGGTFSRIDEYVYIDNEDIMQRVTANYFSEQEDNEIESSRRITSSVNDDKFDMVEELCNRAIKAMGGDRDAMFYNSHLNNNGFVIKGKYIDKIDEDKFGSWGADRSVVNDLWTEVCKSLGMDKLLNITKATDRKNYQMEVEWTGNALTSSRKPIKSGVENLDKIKEFEKRYAKIKGDVDKEEDLIQYYVGRYGIPEETLDEIAFNLRINSSRQIKSSRRAIKSGTSIKEYAGFKIDDSVKINSPKRGPYKNGKTGIVVGFYKRYDGEILISVQLDEGGLMDFSKDELENLGDSGYHITYLDSSRKPIKSSKEPGLAEHDEIFDLEDVIINYTTLSNHYLTDIDVKGYSDNEIGEGEASDCIKDIHYRLNGLNDYLNVLLADIEDGDYDTWEDDKKAVLDKLQAAESLSEEYLVPTSHQVLVDDIFRPVKNLLAKL